MLEIDAAAGAFAGGVAHVAIEDARRADVAAIEVAQVTLRGLVHRAGVAERVPFALTCPDPDGRARYSVRAWVDTTGSGQAGAEDLFSTGRVAVGGPTPLVVRVEPVRS